MARSDDKGWRTYPKWWESLNKKAYARLLRRTSRGLTPEQDLKEAEDRLAGIIRFRGSDSQPAANARADVATRLERLNRYPEARLLREQIVASRRRSNGVDHSYTLTSEEWLAGNLNHSGLTNEARTLCQHIYDVRLRELGPNDPETLKVKRWLENMAGGNQEE